MILIPRYVKDMSTYLSINDRVRKVQSEKPSMPMTVDHAEELELKLGRPFIIPTG
ncbi:protein of unknown function (plasmid) [Azospirillum baldaniorum]|uniref:Uncharacterized protein n=1 Tax=Azospirillum baldaniorum TaxID=1064539 RepID=A0A9P1K1E7_9PROT|nr:protein of unknown function [Azospirillum baldaniorum]